MKTYKVSIPITGTVEIEVKAHNPDAARTSMMLSPEELEDIIGDERLFDSLTTNFDKITAEAIAPIRWFIVQAHPEYPANTRWLTVDTEDMPAEDAQNAIQKALDNLGTEDDASWIGGTIVMLYAAPDLKARLDEEPDLNLTQPEQHYAG